MKMHMIRVSKKKRRSADCACDAGSLLRNGSERRVRCGGISSGERGDFTAWKEGFYRVVPIEYKRGKPKEGEEDILQLAAQAFCLEEMLCCEIEYGYLYYGEVRRRHKVEFDNAIREK